MIFRPKIFIWPTSLRKIQNQALHLKEKFFCWFSAFKNVQPKSSSTSRNGRIVITKNLTQKPVEPGVVVGWSRLWGPKSTKIEFQPQKYQKMGDVKKGIFEPIRRRISSESTFLCFWPPKNDFFREISTKCKSAWAEFFRIFFCVKISWNWSKIFYLRRERAISNLGIFPIGSLYTEICEGHISA